MERKARLEHWCYDCHGAIEPSEEYYELKLEQFRCGYITKHICEQCWQGRELEA